MIDVPILPGFTVDVTVMVAISLFFYAFRVALILALRQGICEAFNFGMSRKNSSGHHPVISPYNPRNPEYRRLYHKLSD